MKLSRRSLLTAAVAAPAVLIPSALHKEPRPVVPTVSPWPRSPAYVNIFSSAKLPLGIKPAPFTAAMQRFVTEFLAPVWGCPAILQWSGGAAAGWMNLEMVDSLEDENAIAYHNFDPAIQGIPYGKIGVYESYEEGTGDLGVPFSHELAEMLVNPGINLWGGAALMTNDAEGNVTSDVPLRAYEVADPVERTYFELDGVRMTNFVYPAYFQPWRAGRLDYLGLLTHAGQILEGGYQLIWDQGKLSDSIGPKAQKVCSRVSEALRRLPYTRLHSGR